MMASAMKMTKEKIMDTNETPNENTKCNAYVHGKEQIVRAALAAMGLGGRVTLCSFAHNDLVRLTWDGLGLDGQTLERVTNAITTALNPERPAQVGESVRLKSGSPAMTVDKIEDDRYHLVWFVDGIAHELVVNAHSLCLD